MYVTERATSATQSRRKKDKQNGAIAQLGERLPCTQEVSGSIPLSSTNYQKGKCEVSFEQGYRRSIR